MLRNIPAELQALGQWVCWRYETVDGRQTKVPYDAKTNRQASVTVPATWSSFDIALAQSKHYNGIGLVLAASDPYTIIDLDNKPDRPCTAEQLQRHNKIYEAFNSYTERSTSGTGVHIIVRGRLPSGMHRDNVEVYSSERYMVCTGDIVRNAPIADAQHLLDILYGEMKPPETSNLVEVAHTLSDMQIVEMAMNAANGAKFNQLCAGDMSEYPSQSEADFALLSIFAFYTQSNEQVRRLFRMTALGKREKAIRNNTYLDFALGKIRATQAPPVDMNQVAANAQAIIQSAAAKAHVQTPAEQLQSPAENFQSEYHEPHIPGLTLPPGIVGEVAEYIYNSAFMPVPEVAIAASIAMFGAIVGRQYNVNGQGLGQYLVLLAETGKGKEGAATGIDRIFAALRPTLPMMDEFRGPAAFASGPAVIRAVSDRPSMLSIQGEFGFTINRLNNAKPGSPESTLKQALMDMYTKSGWASTVQSTVYSDKENNTAIVQAPNLNILGESTQTRFFEGLDITATEDGLVPRLLLIESKGARPYPNMNHGYAPPKAMLDRIAASITAALTMRNNNTCYLIPMDEETREASWQYTCACIDKLNNHNGDPVACLWSRAAAMTARLAGLIAVGVNYAKPVITMAEYRWAKAMVERSIRCLTERFRGGDIGEGDSKQVADLRRIIASYFEKGHNVNGSMVSSKEFHDGMISYKYLVSRTCSLAAFKNDPQKSTGALKKALQTLVDTGELVEVPKNVVLERYKHSARLFGLGSGWHG